MRVPLPALAALALAAPPLLAMRPDVIRSIDAIPPRLTGRFREPMGFQQAASGRHEDDRELHLALNSGIPLVDPAGGFFFVFQTGEPVLQKYDRDGVLVFERRIQGREIDALIAQLPTTWPRRKTSEGEIPLVQPTVRAAAVDPSGHLWVSFVAPYTYVFDADGDRIRALQLRAAGIVAPNSLFFTSRGRLLITPGLYEFEPWAGTAEKAGTAGARR